MELGGEKMEITSQGAAAAAQNESAALDWPAIFGGVVVAVAIGAVFAAFGAGLGLSTVSFEPGEGSFNVMMVISAVWIVVSLVVSYMAGGYIAGRMRRRAALTSADEVVARDGIAGLIVWGVGVILTVVMINGAVMSAMSAAGSVASAAGSAVGTVAEVAGQVAGGAAEGAVDGADSATANPMDFVTSTMLRPDQVAATDPAAPEFTSDAAAIIGNVMLTGEATDLERSYLVSAVAAQAGLTPAEAQTRVDAAITSAQQARTEAMELAETAEQELVQAAEVARISAVLTGFLLAAAALVAAVAAHSGAVMGGRDRDAGSLYGGFTYRARSPRV